MIRRSSGQLQLEFDELVRRFAGPHEGRSVALRIGSTRSSHRATTERPAASVLKIPLVAAVHAQARDGALDLDQLLPCADLPPSRYRSVLDVFDSSHRFTVRELGGLALSISDNRAAHKLFDLVGTAEVNRYLRSIGCLDSELRVGFGDGDLGERGRSNVTTAEDCVRILQAALDDPPSTLGLAASVHSTRLSAGLPDELTVFHKTGTLAGVVNDIGMVETVAGQLFAAFLCDGEASPRQAAHDIADCMRNAWLAVTSAVDNNSAAP